MASKKGLSKGLNAIFGEDIDSFLNDIDTGEIKDKGSAVSLKVSEIRPNPYQPRKVFDKDALNELAESIKEHGVFQPIIVRKSLKGYELIAGERRLRASKLARKTEIPAIIVEFDDKAMMEISLLENIQREDLSAVEEAQAYEQLIKKLDYTQDDLAKRVGKSRTHITNVMRLLKLPSEVQEMITEGTLSYTSARALINVEDEEKVIDLAKRCVSEGLSVRDIERLSKDVKKTPAKEKKKDPYLEDVRKNLIHKYSTSVDVDSSKIIIHYKGTQDLNRILEAMDVIEKEEQ